jgi:hypothetical protein
MAPAKDIIGDEHVPRYEAPTFTVTAGNLTDATKQQNKLTARGGMEVHRQSGLDVTDYEALYSRAHFEHGTAG